MLSPVLVYDDPLEQNHLGRQVRYVDPALWQGECEAIILRGNLEKSSQNDESRVALENIGAHRIVEDSPHYQV